MLSVFIDTILICTATAFMCMCSGIEPTAELAGVGYVQQSIFSALGTFGPVFITISMKAISYINRGMPGKTFMRAYYVIASLLIFLGAGLNSSLLWGIADVTMGFMTLINMPVIVIMSKYVIRALNDYKKQRKEGKDPVFHAKDIDLPHQVDYWN